jgi:hypothetical protein
MTMSPRRLTLFAAGAATIALLLWMAMRLQA